MSLSAVLLAGGQSRRMGEDKATLLFRGRPLWQNQLDILRNVGPEAIFVSARTNPAWRPTDAEFVEDAPPSRGPLSGIAATISRMTSEHLLVLGIDMPFMSPDYLRKPVDRVHPGRGAVPMIDDRAEPLAAIYPRTAKSEFVKALAGENFSLQPLIARLITAGKLQPLKVSDEERALFRNLNEPGDLAGS
jgi:molybdopterin-guanine dinucleotide biosynthesis protein A